MVSLEEKRREVAGLGCILCDGGCNAGGLEGRRRVEYGVRSTKMKVKKKRRLFGVWLRCRSVCV